VTTLLRGCTTSWSCATTPRPASQAAVDLLTSPRRAPSGAEAIFERLSASQIIQAARIEVGHEVGTQPWLSEAMERAHFRSGLQPGSWLRDRSGIATTIPVDLLVPKAVAGPRQAASRASWGSR
jgi:hypothetical protein